MAVEVFIFLLASFLLLAAPKLQVAASEESFLEGFYAIAPVTPATAPPPAPVKPVPEAPLPAPVKPVPTPKVPIPAPVPKAPVPVPVTPVPVPKAPLPAPVKPVPVPKAPTAPTKAPPPAPVVILLPPVAISECPKLCAGRCKLHSRIRNCSRVCITCCQRCKCVPPGTYGNKEMCGKCYTEMTTHGNQPKCP